MSRRYNKKSHFDELRKNEQTSRAGFGWEEGEEEKLLSMRQEKSSYEDIATELKRTPRSIQTRIYQYICRLVENDGASEDELVAKYDVSLDDLKEFKTKRDEYFTKVNSYKRTPRYNKNEGKPYMQNEPRNINNDIRNELNVLRQEVRDLRSELRDIRTRT
jgi:hypothetical protein